MCAGMSSLVRSGTRNFWVGSFHVTWMTSGVWILGGAALIICEGEAIGDILIFGTGVVLVVQFWSSVASCFYDVADVIVGLDHFSG